LKLISIFKKKSSLIQPVVDIQLATGTDIPKFAHRYICRNFNQGRRQGGPGSRLQRLAPLLPPLLLTIHITNIQLLLHF